MKQLLALPIFCVLSLCVLPACASAQTVINPSGIAFTASSDHNAKTIDGNFVVTSYELDAVAMNSVGAIALTVNLGKPTPDSTNTITLPIAQFTTLTPNAVYTAVLKALGPGGAGVSAPSNPFGVLALVLPGIPGNVRVK